MIARTLIAIAVAASLVAGYLLGRQASIATPPTPATVAPQRTSSTATTFPNRLSILQRSADKTDRNRQLANLFSDWLAVDPLAALAEVRRIESLRHDPSRVATAFADWASANPSAAAKLLATVLDGRQVDAANRPPFIDGIDPPEFLLSVVHGLGLTDAPLAAATLATTADSPVRTDAIEVLLQDWHHTDPTAVQTWTASLTDPSLRQIALTTTARKSGQTSPEPGIEWIESLPVADRPATYRALLSQWSQRHSHDAFTWASALPDGDLKFALMPVVLRPLTAVDPGAAADWLNGYEPSPAMDDSIAAYARGIAHVNPAAARGSITAITDPEKRNSILQKLDRMLPPEAER